MAEVHFIGSILGAEGFELGTGQGLTLQYQIITDNYNSLLLTNTGSGLKAGGIGANNSLLSPTSTGKSESNANQISTSNNTAGWQLLEGSPIGNCHTDLPAASDTLTESYPVFAQPIDLHYCTSKLSGWPRIAIQVMKVNALGGYQLVGYGCASLPMIPGHHNFLINCWNPIGATIKDELLGWLLGSPLTPRQWQLISDPSSRFRITAKSTGRICIDLNVLGRHFDNYGITWG